MTHHTYPAKSHDVYLVWLINSGNEQNSRITPTEKVCDAVGYLEFLKNLKCHLEHLQDDMEINGSNKKKSQVIQSDLFGCFLRDLFRGET